MGAVSRQRAAAVPGGGVPVGGPGRAGARDVLAIMSLAIDVARWYPAQRRRTPEGIAQEYADLALRILA